MLTARPIGKQMGTRFGLGFYITPVVVQDGTGRMVEPVNAEKFSLARVFPVFTDNDTTRVILVVVSEKASRQVVFAVIAQE